MSIYTYQNRACLMRAIDGDTYEMEVDLGFRCITRIRVRLMGVNCPERNTTEGKAATQFVEGLLGAWENVSLQTFKDKTSFERWLGIVTLPDGRLLSDILVEAGHGVPA